jgi:hypothetical protein
MFKGHLIVCHRKSGSTMDHVYIYSSLDLARHWRPLGESYDWAYDSEPRPDASVTFALPDGDPRTNHRSHYISLLVAESPLKQQTYDLVVESNDFVAPPALSRWEKIRNRFFKRTSGRRIGWITTTLRYQLTLRSDTSLLREPTLNSIFCYGADDFPSLMDCMTVTASGKYLLNSTNHIIRRVDEAGLNHPFELNLPFSKQDTLHSVHISCSTAVVAIYTSRVVILYYS